MSISDLTAVLPIPPAPVNTDDSGRIAKIEQRLGLALPKDAYDFARTYGSGSFFDMIVFNPLSTRTYLERVTGLCDIFRELKESERGRLSPNEEYIPYDIHPVRPGLLPAPRTATATRCGG
jgi:hypothetical protein